MSYIYFVQAASGPIKIGTARNVARRLNFLQVGSVEKLTLLSSIEGTHRQEGRIHQDFADLHIRGEWFKPEPRLLAFIQDCRERGAAVEPLQALEPAKTLCFHGHALTEGNLTLDGHCRECGNKRSREYQRRKLQERRDLWAKDFPDLQGKCRAGLHLVTPENRMEDGSCRACSNDQSKRWLDTGNNREQWNRARRARRNAKNGNFDVASGEAARSSPYATHCKHGHELSGDNLKITAKQRVCRTCDNIRGATYRERKRSGSLSKAVS